MFIYLERERNSTSRVGAEREAERECQAGSIPSMEQMDTGINLTTGRSQAEQNSRVGWLTD